MTRRRRQNADWGIRNVEDYLFQVSSQFVTQLIEIMESEGITRSRLAKQLGVTKGRVSQILNRPGNQELKNIVEWTYRLNRKVAIVVYDDGDRRHKKVPIPPQVFVESWKRNHQPRDFFALKNSRALVIWTNPDTDRSQLLGLSATTKTAATVGTFPDRIALSYDPSQVAVTAAMRTGTDG